MKKDSQKSTPFNSGSGKKDQDYMRKVSTKKMGENERGIIYDTILIGHYYKIFIQYFLKYPKCNQSCCS